ncbi:DNA replication/repair protein RecF [uncultured Bartonella sp.]|uniref:DNA replication/repair protein RecF n=1 Tax=uncultured Bartonella sp. TaxID=104108 RepID=UPI00260F0A2C|nr:DNA replication/repair protein RecF [uncultured Bartonella sp.]
MVLNNDGQIAKVTVRQLKLTNFRNYRSFSVDFSDGPVVFTGHNGAGKTNLLEALSFLSPGRGLRRASYDTIVGRTEHAQKQNSRGFVVHAQLHSSLFADVAIGTANDTTDGGRKVRINGITVPSERLTDYCRVSWLVPAMDGLFTGSASDRRRFLDRMVLAVDTAHAGRVMDFDKAMRSRNRLLQEGNRDERWFGALEVQMAELAIAIAAARMDVVRLISSIENFDAKGTFPTPVLDIDGTIEQALTRHSAVEVEEAYRQRLVDARELDRAAGRTLDGPHKSDLQVFYAKKNMPAAVCSTGEQKALLTGLVLAHAQLTAEISGMAPILLLDEMAAHLDRGRRAILFECLNSLGGQTFMTGTDSELFSDLKGRAQFFEIANGGLC